MAAPAFLMPFSYLSQFQIILLPQTLLINVFGLLIGWLLVHVPGSRVAPGSCRAAWLGEGRGEQRNSASIENFITRGMNFKWIIRKLKSRAFILSVHETGGAAVMAWEVFAGIKPGSRYHIISDWPPGARCSDLCITRHLSVGIWQCRHFVFA